jgi:hypothetical protein
MHIVPTQHQRLFLLLRLGRSGCGGDRRKNDDQDDLEELYLTKRLVDVLWAVIVFRLNAGLAVNMKVSGSQVASRICNSPKN